MSACEQGGGFPRAFLPKVSYPPKVSELIGAPCVHLLVPEVVPYRCTNLCVCKLATAPAHMRPHNKGSKPHFNHLLCFYVTRHPE